MQYHETFSVTAGATGTARVDIRPRRLQTWTMTQVSTSMPDAPIGSACELRFNGNPYTPMVSTGDVAAGEPPLVMRSTDTLSVMWSAVTPGNVGHVTAFWEAD